MAQVSLTINGRDYQIACDDGQEEHLRDLAEFVDKRLGELAGSVGQVGDARLLVMTSLLIADDLSEAYRQVDELEQSGVSAPDPPAADLPAPDLPAPDPGDENARRALESYAERLEKIAAHLEGA